MLTANRGLCGGYNASVMRLAYRRAGPARPTVPHVRLEVSGKRGISAFRFRNITLAETYTQFEDRPTLRRGRRAGQPLPGRIRQPGRLDRLDVAYTQLRVAQPAAGGGGNAAAADRLGRGRQEESRRPAQPRTNSSLRPRASSTRCVPTSFR